MARRPSVASARYRPAATAMRMPWVAPKRLCSDLAATRFSAHGERGMNRSMAVLLRTEVGVVERKNLGREPGRRFAPDQRRLFSQKGGKFGNPQDPLQFSSPKS